jgi:hypothetical protein
MMGPLLSQLQHDSNRAKPGGDAGDRLHIVRGVCGSRACIVLYLGCIVQEWHHAQHR